jgi:hypothetical protein
MPIPNGPDPFWDHHFASSCWDLGGDSASIAFKASGNADDSQSSSQLVVVNCPLLVESFKALDVLVGFGELLSLTGGSLAYSGDKPIGCGMDGGIDCRVKGKDCLSQSKGDRRVFVAGEVDEPSNGPWVEGCPFLFVVSDKGACEGGSCRLQQDLQSGTFGGFRG